MAGDGEPWDLVVVGGGITGAGVLREAARRGWRVLLVEQRDFAWGTSSRSARMIHGGLRYLTQGDLRLTREAVAERERLLREAPGLVDELPFLYPVRKGEFPGRRVFSSLLWFYDRFAGRSRHRFHSAEETAWLLPGLDEAGLQGAVGYVDAVTDDARLVMRLLAAARRDGGEAFNYLRAEGLQRGEDGVEGVELVDEVDGRRLTLEARCVVNATGAWADRLRDSVGGAPRLRPLKGSHLVVPAWRLPVFQALACRHPRDGRFVYLYPWAGRTVVGTTDFDYEGDLDEEPGISRAEVAYLLEAVHAQFPAAGIDEGDIVSTWSGIRPIVAKAGDDPARIAPSKASRDHVVFVEDGLVTVTGGKLTTFRLMANDVLRRAARRVGRAFAADHETPVFSPAPAHLPGLRFDNELPRRLGGTYGTAAVRLLAEAGAEEREPVPGTDTLWAELAWSARREAVVHLDDLLLRRSRVGLLLDDGGASLAERVEALCRRDLGWDALRWEEEWQRYRAIHAARYAVPHRDRPGEKQR
ncbi:glycerol-3-phosphate dehydrogenase/oxidase [Wenzhouxiangella sediminis]|uniref:Glycerol-3-phosphate dehydrogenase/oxidase n=1 Tax=Wenzhouxiangella sediminis TaxID=1792836 RepID=A0A3E1K5Y7_9GAMM|nr:glycerol-3-phosphate dehydrogenase/oxidase [Wenzhouxiangella sediminis]